jgi:hypothetical protein
VLDANGAIDEAATETRRREIAETRGWTTPPLHGFDCARRDHVALWTDALEDALAGTVAGLPVQLAQFLHTRLKAEVAARLEAGATVTPGDIEALAADFRAAYEGTSPLAAE